MASKFEFDAIEAEFEILEVELEATGDEFVVCGVEIFEVELFRVDLGLLGVEIFRVDS